MSLIAKDVVVDYQTASGGITNALAGISLTVEEGEQYRVGIVEIAPGEGNVVAREELAELDAPDVAMRADDRRDDRLRVGHHLLQVADATLHRLHDLRIEHSAMRNEVVKVRGLEAHHARRLERTQAGDGG